jgi:acetyl esterase/lipase
MNFAAICLAVAFLCLIEALAPTGLRAASTAAPIRPVPKVFKDIAYAGTATDERRQSFDLYLPAKSVGKPPLLIFIHGGFWLLSDDEYRIGPSIAENLVQEGVAVALVRYRLAPGNRYPVQAQDVAAAVAALVKSADKYGYDQKRIYLAGHSAGGQLASLVSLDRAYLASQGLRADAIAGVISLSGLYDLNPTWDVSENQKSATEKTFGNDTTTLKRASPMHHVRADAPPFLILTAFQDFRGFALDARRFADALRNAGNRKVQQLMVKGVDHFTVVKLDDANNAVRRVILGFIGAKPLTPELAELIEAQQRWADPPYSTRSFWKYSKLIRSYPVDDRFMKMLLFVYRNRKEELLEWPLRQYHAVDLFSYLNTLPKQQAGEGDYIVLTNIRGERQVWKREQIERFKPVIIIGVDDERNLFRFSVFYRMYHEYSWKPGRPPPSLTLTLGAFIHFLEPPPRELTAQSWHFGLTENSFRRMKDDPLKAIRDVPKDVEEAVTFRNGCVYCHSFRGIGTRSHHIHATTGKPQGGFALPLESYPTDVWKTFMFDQEAVAKKMGATPNIVQESARQALFDLVDRSRQEQAKPEGK